MTALIRNFFQGFDASSSGIETDYLTLSLDNVRGIAHLVGRGVKLKERQCQDLSSKLVKTVENIQKLVVHAGAATVLFRPALKNFYIVSEKGKLLVSNCSETDWCRAAVFQILNEEAFRQILLEVGLCYNIIYEQAKGVMRDSDWRLLQAEDLRQLSTFSPASESEVFADQQSLEKNLQQLADTSDDPNQCLARYLLGRLKCISEERMNEDFGMPDAVLWVNETEQQETWKLLRVIGSGSGASCVCSYKWLDIPCARKEFHCKVVDGIFRREVAILARLNHPNIVKFFCCSNGSKMGRCFIAMELMEMSLDDLIDSRRNAGQRFPIPVALDIIAQIARGVCYLHELKIAHRDLKPQNVVVTEIPTLHLEDNFCVKLVDFGMSKTKLQVSKSNTISMPGVGTTMYRAPEVFPEAHQRVKRKVNWFQADAYSFAVTCVVLLSLEEPYQGVRMCNLYEELLSGRRPKLPRECPEDLAALLIECWDTNPQSRPNFADICTRLEKCKLHHFLRRKSTAKSGDLQLLMSYKYIETVLRNQALVQSQALVQAQCAATIPCESDLIKKEDFTSAELRISLGNQVDQTTSMTMIFFKILVRWARRLEQCSWRFWRLVS